MTVSRSSIGSCLSFVYPSGNAVGDSIGAIDENDSAWTMFAFSWDLRGSSKGGRIMKRVALLFAVAAILASSTARSADLAVKAAPAAPAAAAPSTPVWDVAITGALMSDYNFRGITQSNHRPSAAAGFEPRYNINPNLQAYAGVSGESIDFPNRAAAEIDLYGGIRPTFGKLALDGGFYYYYYPDGQCFNTPAFCGGAGQGILPNGNVVKQNLSFYEFYGKGTYTVNGSRTIRRLRE
jgi:hypothetical protein